MVSAVKSISQFYFDKGVQNVQTSLSLKIGYSLKKCTNILQGQALQRKDKGLEEDVDKFETYGLRVELLCFASFHQGSQHKKKFNKVELLPLVDGLEQLKKIVLLKDVFHHKSRRTAASTGGLE